MPGIMLILGATTPAISTHEPKCGPGLVEVTAPVTAVNRRSVTVKNLIPLAPVIEGFRGVFANAADLLPEFRKPPSSACRDCWGGLGGGDGGSFPIKPPLEKRPYPPASRPNGYNGGVA